MDFECPFCEARAAVAAGEAGELPFDLLSRPNFARIDFTKIKSDTDILELVELFGRLMHEQMESQAQLSAFQMKKLTLLYVFNIGAEKGSRAHQILRKFMKDN